MKRNVVAFGALVAILAAHAALALHAARRSSVTIDEFAHLPAGLSYWQQGTFALYHHNPPLAKLLAALPVLAAHPVVDYSGSWAAARAAGHPPSQIDFATEFMRANTRRYFALFNRARAVIVALSVVGGLLVFLWARELWGPPAGLLAAALWAFEPNLIAHAGLATTDMAATVLIFAATYSFWRFVNRPSWGRSALCGVVFGLALLAKFSALLMYPALPVLALLRALVRRRTEADGTAGSRAMRAGGAAALGPWILAPALALLVLNLGYAFEGTGRRLDSFPFLSTTLTRARSGGTPPRSPYAFYRMIYAQRQNRFEGTWLGALRVPLPEHYLLGFDEQRFESKTGLRGGGYAVYLRGVIRRTGWWWYFLYALAVKTPIALWLIAALAIAAAARAPAARRSWPEEMFWILPAASGLLGMSLMTGLDLGVRYVLPVLPFLYVGLARAATLPARANRAGGIVLGVALAWLLVATAIVHPHELSYFNELAGGPAKGHRHLLDSNLDWGQDLLELRRYFDRHPPSETPWLAYFGSIDPHVAGIPYRVPPRDPRVVAPRHMVESDTNRLLPGTYAVSVNFVQGLPHRVIDPDDQSLAVDQDAFGYFRLLKPVARAGWSIGIYRVTEEDAARVEAAWRRGPPAL